jgi:hypothetical protein
MRDGGNSQPGEDAEGGLKKGCFNYVCDAVANKAGCNHWYQNLPTLDKNRPDN